MGSGSRAVEVRRSALVAHPAARIFAVIEAAEDYPAFLPWCAGATILQRDEQVVSARIHVAWRGVRFSFVTRNPKRPPEWMSIGLEEGPFRRFEGQWNLAPLAEWGCRVEFVLSYEMNSAILGALAGPVFDHAVNTLVDAFIRRADQVAAGLASISTQVVAPEVRLDAPAPAQAAATSVAPGPSTPLTIPTPPALPATPPSQAEPFAPAATAAPLPAGTQPSGRGPDDGAADGMMEHSPENKT